MSLTCVKMGIGRELLVPLSEVSEVVVVLLG